MREYVETGAPPLPADEQVEFAVEVFGMLADPTRVRLLWLLRTGESPVLQLAEQVGKPQAAVSQYLAKPRLARLVTTRRQGAQVFYALTNDHVSQLHSPDRRAAPSVGDSRERCRCDDQSARTPGQLG